MANLFYKRSMSYFPESPPWPHWESDNDNVLYELANNLYNCGWAVQYRYHYGKIRTATNMSHFDPISGGYVFWQVTPGVDSGYAGLIPLIVDDPGSFTPPPTHFIFEITGTTDKAVVHDAIIRCIKTFSNKIKEAGSDPDDAEPNTYLQWKEYDSEGAFPAGVLHRDRDIFGSCAVGLHTSVERLANGGYACTTAANGSSDNTTSVFLYRNTTGGIEPNHPSLFFAKSIPQQPVFINTTEGVNRTTQLTIQMTRADLMIAMGPHYFYLAQTSNGLNAHAEMAALTLPVAGSGLTEATFSVGGSSALTASASFRNSPLTATTSGCSHLSRNGISRYGNVGLANRPRFMTLFGVLPGGHQWENQLGQISEPWVGFQHEISGIAPVLGKLPEAIVVHKSLADTGAFLWDNVSYKPWGYNVEVTGSLSVHGLGTLCLKTEDVAGEPDCVP